MPTLSIEKELKRDTFGCVELLTVQDDSGAKVRLVRRVVTAGFLVGSVAKVLARRESRALEALRGSGVTPIAREVPLSSTDRDAARALPTLGGQAPKPGAVFLRPFADGLPLHRAERLPHDFFGLLEERVRALHAAGVCHNDLHKEQNIVVAPDGRPVLIDFQLGTRHPKRSGRWFRARCTDDLRHIQKHRRRYTRDGRGPEELRVPEASRMKRRGIPLVWMKTGKPLYKFITRKILRTRDGEDMRPSVGPWPQWTGPIGPLPSGTGSKAE